MKQLETREVTVGGSHFYIKPFPAFKAANMSAELAALVTPLLAGFAPLVSEAGGDTNLLDIDIEDAIPSITKAFSALSGDRLEAILKHLLIAGENVSYEPEGEKVRLLTEDLANEIFCEEVQDMFVLAFEVVRTNYNGFFKKLGNRFGSAIEGLNKRVMPSLQNTVNSI